MWKRSPLRLALLLLSCAASVGQAGSCWVKPVSGIVDYQRFGLIPVPGGHYSAAGRNLLVERMDLPLDTPLWTIGVAATYGSASGWHWAHESRFDGLVFVDPTGAVYEIPSLADGDAIPGTHWVRESAQAMRTKGGRSYHFDAQGRIDHLTLANTSHPRIQFVWTGAALEQRLCTTASVPPTLCPLLLTLTLGPWGPVAAVDERSAATGIPRTASYAYDPQGRLTLARSEVDHALGLPGTGYEYLPTTHWLAAIDSTDGERTEYGWSFNRLASVTQIGAMGAANPTTHFGYRKDPLTDRYIVVHVNPTGGVTEIEFDAERRVHEIRRVLQNAQWSIEETRSIAWPASGVRPTAITELDGTTQTFLAYDNDDPTLVQMPSGNRVEIVYEPAGINFSNPFQSAVARISDSIGAMSQTTHDALGRPRDTISGENETVTTLYTSSTLASVSAPWGNTLEYPQYGMHGHWTVARLPAEPGIELRRSFDVVGNLQVNEPTFQPGGVVEYQYGAARLPATLRVTATDGQGDLGAEDTVSVTRRGDGRPTSVRRPAGADHEMEYDALGHLIRRCERVDAACQDTLFERDAAGRLTAMERPNGMRMELDRDPYGRITHRRTLQGGALEAWAEFEWNDGRVERSYDSVRGQWETIHFDSAGRPAVHEYSALGETLLTSYDERSRIVQETYVHGTAVRRIGRAWDLADRETRLFSIDDAGAEETLALRTYADGRLVSSVFGNGLTRTVLYDPLNGRQVGHRTEDPQGGVVEDSSFSVQPRANPARLEVTTRTDTPVASSEEHYWLTPDSSAGRRIFHWRGFADGMLDVERSYAFDALGNPASGTYNGERNRMLTATLGGVPHSYAYDAAGFVTSRDGLPITWTATGRLASIGAAPMPLAELEWDVGGRLVAVTLLGDRREYRLFGGRVGSDPQSGAATELHAGPVTLAFAGSARRYRHADALRNTSFVTDENGAVVLHKRYGPFGVDQVYGPGGGMDGELVGFVGGKELPGTGLALLGVRVLDADAGRFLSPDPIVDDLNQYTYAYGNPIQWWDPDGRHAEAKPAGGGTAGANVDVVTAGLALTAAVAAAVAFVAVSPAVVTGASALSISAAIFAAALSLAEAVSAGMAADGSVSIEDCPCPPAQMMGAPMIQTNFGGAGAISGFGGCSTAAGPGPPDPLHSGATLAWSVLASLLLCQRTPRWRSPR